MRPVPNKSSSQRLHQAVLTLGCTRTGLDAMLTAMSSRAARLLLPVIYLGFVSLGLPDGTLGVAWPRMHEALGLPVGLAGTLLLVVTLLSGVSSFSSGAVIRRLRTGPVVLASCVMTGSALLVIGRSQDLVWLLVAAVPLGLGAGAVDAGLNGYVARHYTGRHMNWLHACWGVGATCGPLIMAAAMQEDDGWRRGYVLIGTVQLTLALVFVATLRLWSAVPEREFGSGGAARADGARPTATANSEAGWISAAIFAAYVAVEMTAGLWAGSVLAIERGMPVATAGVCVSAYYAAITGGRILTGFVVERWGSRTMVTGGLLVALGGALVFTQATTWPVAGLALTALGAGFAPLYPCLMHEVPRRFVPEAIQTVIGRQSGAAYIGAAALPALAGWVAQSIALGAIVWVIAAGIVVMIAAVRRLDRIT